MCRILGLNFNGAKSINALLEPTKTQNAQFARHASVTRGLRNTTFGSEDTGKKAEDSGEQMPCVGSIARDLRGAAAGRETGNATGFCPSG